MDVGQFVTKIRRLHPMQSVTLCFAETGMTGLLRLKGLLDSDKRVRLEERDKIIMLAVLESRRWEGATNQRYVVYGLSSADDNWLLAIAPDVASLEVAEHGAMKLVTSRGKMREAAAGWLVAEILTSSFRKELEDWGLSPCPSLEELEYLPALTFRMLLGESTLVSVSIDGWSGRIALNGSFTEERYVRPKQVQDHLRSLMLSALERATAPATAA